MGRTRTKVPKAATPGERTGTKRRDTRWTAPDQSVWASRFEYEVYLALKAQGYEVRKTTEKDSLRYTHPVRNGRCLQCGSGRVVSEHSYTPDLFVSTGRAADNQPSGYYLEVKGYLRAPRRALLRSFHKARPDIDIRFIAQRDYAVGATTLTGWAKKFLKSPVHIWDGKLPAEWGR